MGKGRGVGSTCLSCALLVPLRRAWKRVHWGEVWGDVIAQAVEKETPFSSLCTAFLPTWVEPPPLVLTKTLCDLL